MEIAQSTLYSAITVTHTEFSDLKNNTKNNKQQTK